jgi:hypothetical protein
VRAFAAAGGLTGYGEQRLDSLRSAGVYAGRILHRFADRAAEQIRHGDQSQGEAPGLTVPPTLLATVDEVVE